jgi:hypothetical protein
MYLYIHLSPFLLFLSPVIHRAKSKGAFHKRDGWSSGQVRPVWSVVECPITVTTVLLPPFHLAAIHSGDRYLGHPGHWTTETPAHDSPSFSQNFNLKEESPRVSLWSLRPSACVAKYLDNSTYYILYYVCVPVQQDGLLVKGWGANTGLAWMSTGVGIMGSARARGWVTTPHPHHTHRPPPPYPSLYLFLALTCHVWVFRSVWGDRWDKRVRIRLTLSPYML